jgi:DeoR/GlpR family transcriptional regulator of sugar metabolism/ABC-type sugar transport system substrate-binding protein
MIKDQRHKRIVTILHREGSVDIDTLSRLMPEVSRVTLRRDLAELAEAGALKRTHGGAVLPDSGLIARAGPLNATADLAEIVSALDEFDAVILPPIPGRGSEALRRDICRRDIPFVAESASQAGGNYVGPNNYAAGWELGCLAGARFSTRTSRVLIVGLHALSNTRARAEGFKAGFEQRAHKGAQFFFVDGKGSFKTALKVATDAFRAEDLINVVFGVNDHSTIAGLEAAFQTGAEVEAYAVGGESAEFVARVSETGPLKAVSAFFPEAVGAIAIDVVAGLLAGEQIGSRTTPHRIVTADNLGQFYELSSGEWQLRAECFSELIEPVPLAAQRCPRGKCVGFMPHYPAHDWYRTLSQALSVRARLYDMRVVVTPPHQGIAAEIARLQSEIAKAAVERIGSGMAVVLGEGQPTRFMADEIRRLAFADRNRFEGVTIVTNSLDVLFRLEDAPGFKVILTSGEYQKSDRCLVGPSLGALFERLRPDLAFITAAGVSPSFGISSVDERRALVAQRIMQAARKTCVLVDHTALGVEANHRIAQLDKVSEIITDDGALPRDRHALRGAGPDVTIAGEPTITGQDEVPVVASAQPAEAI